MKHTFHLLICCSALWVSLPCWAQYSWIDQSGQQVFSDQPAPANIPKKNLRSIKTKIMPSTAEALSNEAKDQASKQLDAKKKTGDQVELSKTLAKEREQLFQRQVNCFNARKAMTQLNSNNRIFQLDEKGESSFMSDKQRNAEIERTQNFITSNCP